MIVLAELRAVLARVRTVVLVSTTLVAAGVCLRPPLVAGDDLTFGPSATWPGLAAGAVLAALVGPVIAAAVAHTAEEGGLREVSFLAGRPPWRQLLAQAGAVALVIVATAALTAIQAGVLGSTDLLARQLGGAPTRRADVVAPADLRTTAVAGVLGILASLVVLLLGRILRSGAAAATTIVLAQGSWLLLLLATRGSEHRGWLAAHPLAAPWTALGPDLGETLSPALPLATTLASGAFWALVMVVAVLRTAGGVRFVAQPRKVG